MGELVKVMAKVHLRGLAPGSVVRVDPEHPYVADALREGVFVRVPVEAVESVPEPSAPAETTTTLPE